jgi:hypothetical protein
MVLLHAMVGTICNALITGGILYAAAPLFVYPLPLLDGKERSLFLQIVSR